MSSQVQKHESKVRGFILESVTLYALRNFNINYSLMSTAPQITWILYSGLQKWDALLCCTVCGIVSSIAVSQKAAQLYF